MAFNIISISNFPKAILETKADIATLELIERTVLIMALYLALVLARAPLKDGQNSHRKRVPIKAIVFDE